MEEEQFFWEDLYLDFEIELIQIEKNSWKFM